MRAWIELHREGGRAGGQPRSSGSASIREPDRREGARTRLPVPAEPARLEEGRDRHRRVSSASLRHAGIDLQGHRDHQKELPVIRLHAAAPLPGSEDHKVLWERRLDGPDVSAAPSTWSPQSILSRKVGRTPQRLEGVYTPDHIETILRRGGKQLQHLRLRRSSGFSAALELTPTMPACYGEISA